MYIKTTIDSKGYYITWFTNENSAFAAAILISIAIRSTIST